MIYDMIYDIPFIIYHIIIYHISWYIIYHIIIYHILPSFQKPEKISSSLRCHLKIDRRLVRLDGESIEDEHACALLPSWARCSLQPKPGFLSKIQKAFSHIDPFGAVGKGPGTLVEQSLSTNMNIHQEPNVQTLWMNENSMTRLDWNCAEGISSINIHIWLYVWLHDRLWHALCFLTCPLVIGSVAIWCFFCLGSIATRHIGINRYSHNFFELSNHVPSSEPVFVTFCTTVTSTTTSQGMCLDCRFGTTSGAYLERMEWVFGWPIFHCWLHCHYRQRRGIHHLWNTAVAVSARRRSKSLEFIGRPTFVPQKV